jgi:hypothetical protein
MSTFAAAAYNVVRMRCYGQQFKPRKSGEKCAPKRKVAKSGALQHLQKRDFARSWIGSPPGHWRHGKLNSVFSASC